jgi:endonuclease/exonuclease/phosphatase family metal-dependent hydrolase
MMGCVPLTGIRTIAVAVVLMSSLACGGTSLTGPSGSVKARRSFTVMTFNVQHGIDGSSRYNLQAAIDVIARLQPDLVGVQELTRNHPFYNCDDQPALIINGLRNATGRPWAGVYVKEWFTPDRTCLDRGTGTEVETEGLAVFAPEGLQSTQDLPLFNTRLGLAARTSSVPGVPVIVTQLASGTAGFSDRVTQLGQLLPWAGSQGVPRILIGDFNARPDTPEMVPVTAEYRDAWTDALAQGVARGVMSGDTRVKGGRIDYVFYTPSDALTIDSAEIVDTAALVGGRDASDHRPVIVRFSSK